LEVVDPELNATTFAVDSIVIPVVQFEHLCELGLVRRGQNAIATGLVVKCAQ
jgi:hypothetical protein